jgi:hypothetical protein
VFLIRCLEMKKQNKIEKPYPSSSAFFCTYF